MSDEIKEILKTIKSYEDEEVCLIILNQDQNKALLDYITNLQEENERLKEQNNDLRKIYKNTYNRLFEIGNDELARYFQAQIDDCPTFYVEPIIDFVKEWKDYKSRVEKAIEYIKSLCYIESKNEWFTYGDDLNPEHIVNILQGAQND